MRVSWVVSSYSLELILIGKRGKKGTYFYDEYVSYLLLRDSTST